MALGTGTNTKGVNETWNTLIARYGSEVAVLVDADVKNSGVDKRVIDAIAAFRCGKVKVIPGGGGQYGKIELSDANCKPQKSLFDFRPT